MKAHELRLGRPLAEVLREEYQQRTLAEIGEAWGVSPATISRWMKAFDIPTSHRKLAVVPDSPVDGSPDSPDARPPVGEESPANGEEEAA